MNDQTFPAFFRVIVVRLARQADRGPREGRELLARLEILAQRGMLAPQALLDKSAPLDHLEGVGRGWVIHITRNLCKCIFLVLVHCI